MLSEYSFSGYLLPIASFLQLMKQVSIASVFAALSMCTVMYFVIAYHEYRNLSSILGAVFDTLLARLDERQYKFYLFLLISSYCVMLSLVVFSQPSWRDSFAKTIGLARWYFYKDIFMK